MSMKMIRTKADHEIAIERLADLMELPLDVGSPEDEELEILAILIEKYEEEFFPIDLPTPIDAIKFRMEQQGLVRKDLIPLIGSASKVSEVLNGKRKLSLSMIRKLNKYLHMPADVLIQEIPLSLNDEKIVSWEKFPVAAMFKKGYFPEFKEKLSELKIYAEENLRSFFDKVSGSYDLAPALMRSSAQHSATKDVDHYALWAWQVKVLGDTTLQKAIPSYIEGAVNSDFLDEVARLSWYSQGPILAKEYLNKHGIHFVIEHHLPKTYLDGAVFLNRKGNPVVAMTLRYDRLDNFWFTLLHELAHIQLHIRGNDWIFDDLDSTISDTIEDDANESAINALLGPYRETLSLDATVDEIKSFAMKYKISPAIPAGYLRHKTKDFRRYQSLIPRVRNVFDPHGCKCA